MERLTISKLEKQTLYEIYRACRICGAGGGYRMPIIQNIVDLDTSDVELRQKIQDCLQLEVRSDDRMPPLICELCVDKINDFHEFLKLSKQTNIRTRTRLGLPLQTARKEESSSGDCVIVPETPSADKPAPKRSTAGPKCSKNIKKERENAKIEVEARAPSPAESRGSGASSRSGRARRAPSPPRPARAPSPPRLARAPTPPRPARVPKPDPKTTQLQSTAKVTQDKKRVIEKEKEQERGKDIKEFKMGRRMGKELSDLIQDSQKYNDNSLLMPRSMKRKEIEPPRPAIVPKRTRTTTKEPITEPVREPSPPRRKPGPKSRRAPREDPKEDPKPRQAPKEDPKPRQAPKEDPKPRQAPKEDPKIPVPLKILKSKSKLNVASTPPKVEEPPPKAPLGCLICDIPLKTGSAVANHMRTHQPTFTKLCQACNPCGMWFATTEEAVVHHRYHRAATFPYHCRRCFEDYKSLQDYDRHISNGLCMPYDLIPDVKCEKCWKTFITRTLLDAHKCQGVDGRPGGICSKCSRSYMTQRTLKAHQKSCTYKKPTGGLIADPDVLRRLKPMQVRVSRCDDLARPGDRVDVSAVRQNYGLDKTYLYPYMRFKPVKPKPLQYRGIVPANGPIRDAHKRDRYTHWDSDDSSDSIIKKVDSLSTLCLKKLFSKNMLGKIPRKKRKVENNAFDSTNDFSMSNDISNIISSLNDDLSNVCAPRNRKDSLIAIAVNDIIGVPNSFVPNFKLGNEDVARSSNDVHIDDKNENDSKLNKKNECLNENGNLKDLNDVEIENEGTDTVVSASDISTELHLIETEDQDNTRSEAASEKMGDDVETNDLDNKNKDGNVELNNDEIRNFKSVDGQNNNGNFEKCNETNVQNNHLGTEEDHKNAENNICDSDNQNKSDNVDSNNDLEKHANTESTIANNCSEIGNDNLDIENNYENIDMDIDLESRNSKHENKDSKMLNDNLGIENNFDKPAIYHSNIQNENNDMQHSSETDMNINHTDIKNNDGNDMNNYLENHNDNLEVVKLNSENIHKDCMNSNVDTENNENTQLHRIGNETENPKVSENILEEPSLIAQNSMENEHKNLAVNGIHDNDTNHNFGESRKSEETKKLTSESPIKHSIENLIGDTDKNPDKYIDEVISSIEDIINKNARNKDTSDNFSNGENSNEIDDHALLDALDTQIGEGKEKTDNEKITLDDLLPKDNTSMELDDISDDDFNFDA